MSNIIHDIEAEQAILGALLLEKGAFDEVANILTSNSFYEPNHQIIFTIIANLHRENKKVDMLTVAHALQEINSDIPIYSLAELTARVATAAHIRDHATIIADIAVRRNLIETAQSIVSKAGTLNTDEMLSLWREQLDITEEAAAAANDAPVSLKDYLPIAANKLNEPDGGQGLTTGFPSLDRHLSGLKAGRLYIIGGRPGQGKTSIALNTAIENAKEGYTTLFISAEQDVNDLANKIIGSTSGLGHQHLDNKRLTANDWEKIEQSLATIERLKGNIFLKDNPSNITHITALVRTLKKRSQLHLVIVDYLQLISPAAKKNNRIREQEVSEISRTLKQLSLSEKLPIIALSQLNRDVKGRPELHHLRESGAIEQDADAVLLIYRPALDGSVEHGLEYGEIQLAKNRRGASGVAVKFYNKDMAQFSEEPFDRPF